MATNNENIMHKKYDRQQVINLLKRYPFVRCHSCIAREDCKIKGDIRDFREHGMLYSVMVSSQSNVKECVLAKMRFLLKIAEERVKEYRFD